MIKSVEIQELALIIAKIKRHFAIHAKTRPAVVTKMEAIVLVATQVKSAAKVGKTLGVAKMTKNAELQVNVLLSATIKKQSAN